MSICVSRTGRVALEAAITADTVFAVEPVARLRRFIHEKATHEGRRNVHVVEGVGHAVLLPDGFADVVITSHALGWRLEEELAEFEGMTAPGGYIIHCPGTAENPHNKSEEEQHECLVSSEWGYEFARYREGDGWKRKYWKRLHHASQAGILTAHQGETG